MRAWYRGFGLLGLLGALLLGGCAAHNPLLGQWTFERYSGGGDLGSVLGGLAAPFSKGTTVEFTSSTMIVSQGDQKSRIAVDHYDIKGNRVTVWLKSTPSVIRAETYVVSDDGQSISHELAGSGMNEVFTRKPGA
ncbi:hypothetical protein [Acidihalobacter prosperus]|uniref:Lipocalin-like domain-containing protein n=1 Tax=Acidihalobacter prosperus TaxID=160660 RepID=A0A1A6C5Y1_9GAMM|nr:hypothetical protein [Acidihalobacter prosperus]OBS09981.1 hypothetical protein Thpro_021031 [Acidihalobacter prosperus]